jgi:hypothetical protein
MTTKYRYNINGKNFGYGKQISFAVKNALKDRFGDGKYATRAAHEARFNHFNSYLKEQGIKDLKKNRQEYNSEIWAQIKCRRTSQRSVYFLCTKPHFHCECSDVASKR